MDSRRFKILYKVSVIVLAVLATLLLSSFILMILGADIFRTFYTIVITPLTRVGHLTEVFVRAVPLCIIALGVAIAYRSGIINIGAEGQMAMGILGFTTVALSAPELPRPLLLPLALLAGVVCGGLWGFIPGILKAKLQVSELLSTVMLNYIAAQFYSFCLRVPLLDPAEALSGAGTPQSARLTTSIEIGRITGRLHYGVFIALVLAVLVYLFMWKTSFGYKMRASGAQSRAARDCGRPQKGDRGRHQQLRLQRRRRGSVRNAAPVRYRACIVLLRPADLRFDPHPACRGRAREHRGCHAGTHHHRDSHDADDPPEHIS